VVDVDKGGEGVLGEAPGEVPREVPVMPFSMAKSVVHVLARTILSQCKTSLHCLTKRQWKAYLSSFRPQFAGEGCWKRFSRMLHLVCLLRT
jgi:hypothetical protein